VKHTSHRYRAARPLPVPSPGLAPSTVVLFINTFVLLVPTVLQSDVGSAVLGWALRAALGILGQVLAFRHCDFAAVSSACALPPLGFSLPRAEGITF